MTLLIKDASGGLNKITRMVQRCLYKFPEFPRRSNMPAARAGTRAPCWGAYWKRENTIVGGKHLDADVWLGRDPFREIPFRDKTSPPPPAETNSYIYVVCTCKIIINKKSQQQRITSKINTNFSVIEFEFYTYI